MANYIHKYYCFNCKKSIDPRKAYCPYCNEQQPFQERANALNMELMNIKCPKCGCEISLLSKSSYFDLGECALCGSKTYINKENKKVMPNIKSQPIVECPYCHSTNTKKISGASKAGKIAAFGIFSIGKVTKQWHCNNCKSDF